MSIIKSIIKWIKNNKLTVLLLLVILFLLFENYYVTPLKTAEKVLEEVNYKNAPKFLPHAEGVAEPTPNLTSPPSEPSPLPEVEKGMVVKECYLSLVVKNVVEAQKQIIKKAESLGGYMVNSNLDNPQEAATATVIVRVPSQNLDQALEYFRGLSVKVISENLQGRDVGDQYVDIEARLSTLLKTKAKFEEIMEKATKIQDILNVQREIINLQSQIDALKGQKQYLEQSAKLAKLTIHLSTDELALPSAPSEAWRPQVIFKHAVRSLIGNLRKLGAALIWLAVYSVIWIPLGIILIIVFRRGKKRL